VFSYSHGTNDAQKTMGIITGVLFTAKLIATFDVPVWVIFSAHVAVALGTLSGGRRIIKTMGGRQGLNREAVSAPRPQPLSPFCFPPN